MPVTASSLSATSFPSAERSSTTVSSSGWPSWADSVQICKGRPAWASSRYESVSRFAERMPFTAISPAPRASISRGSRKSVAAATSNSPPSAIPAEPTTDSRHNPGGASAGTRNSASSLSACRFKISPRNTCEVGASGVTGRVVGYVIRKYSARRAWVSRTSDAPSKPWPETVSRAVDPGAAPSRER